MKVSDLASSASTAWIVALATVGALSFIPSRSGGDDLRVARPPLADVSVVAPVPRGVVQEGVDDMAHHDDELHAEQRYARGVRAQAEPES